MTRPFHGFGAIVVLACLLFVTVSPNATAFRLRSGFETGDLHSLSDCPIKRQGLPQLPLTQRMKKSDSEAVITQQENVPGFRLRVVREAHFQSYRLSLPLEKIYFWVPGNRGKGDFLS